MEIICRILQQHPLSSIEYTDRQGQQKTFHAIGFELASGADTIYAELTGDQALWHTRKSSKIYIRSAIFERFLKIFV